MRTLGFPHEFKSDSWLDVRDRLSAIASTNQEFRYVVEIIDSVIESGRTGQ